MLQKSPIMFTMLREPSIRLHPMFGGKPQQMDRDFIAR
jgi:hypothetical protein